MPKLGTTELMVVSLVLVFLFGGKKIPELAKGVAASVREFKTAAKQ